MREPQKADEPQELQRLQQMLTQVMIYQSTLPDGRAVELDELAREGVLSPDDLSFLTTHSVTYKPYRVSAPNALDMFHLPTPDGCVFIGPQGPLLTRRSTPLAAFAPIVENFLNLPAPRDHHLLVIDFTGDDGMGIAPEMISFTLRSPEWRQRLPAIRCIAAEFGFHPFQDAEVQQNWLLTFRTPLNAAHSTAAVIALLHRGCGFTHDTEITYSHGDQDET
jgi:hypothetical protein